MRERNTSGVPREDNTTLTTQYLFVKSMTPERKSANESWFYRRKNIQIKLIFNTNTTVNVD